MLKPPIAKQVPRITEIHGYQLVDHYAWMREKGGADVVAHLEAENAYTEAVLSPYKGLQEVLYAEMLGRIKETDLSVPSRIGDFLVRRPHRAGPAVSEHVPPAGKHGAAEETLLDPNRPAEGRSFLAVGAFTVSDDGRPGWRTRSTPSATGRTRCISRTYTPARRSPPRR